MQSVEWFSVEECLPEDGEEVLSFYFNEDDEVYYDVVFHLKGKFYAGLTQLEHTVFWMPLPEIPEEYSLGLLPHK